MIVDAVALGFFPRVRRRTEGERGCREEGPGSQRSTSCQGLARRREYHLSLGVQRGGRGGLRQLIEREGSIYDKQKIKDGCTNALCYGSAKIASSLYKVVIKFMKKIVS